MIPSIAAPLIYFSGSHELLVTTTYDDTGGLLYSEETPCTPEERHTLYIKALYQFLTDIEANPGFIYTNSHRLLLYFYRRMPYSAPKYYAAEARYERLKYLLDVTTIADSRDIHLRLWLENWTLPKG